MHTIEKVSEKGLDVAAEVARFLQRYSTMRRIGVAVSGGADSVVLLRCLAAIPSSSLVVLHVNHGLRGATSDGDEAFVRLLAAELGLPFHTVHAAPGPGNLEAECRRVRQAFFQQIRASEALHAIAVGHTASDQAETVLFRFLRGSGTAGLSGMAPRTRNGLLRPLLEITRPQVRAYAVAQGWPWRDDHTNFDLRFRRNRLRLETIPGLAKAFNPSLEHVLATHAALAFDEERYWHAKIARLLPKVAVFLSDGVAVADAAQLLRYPLAVQRRLLRALVAAVKGDLQRIDAAHIEAARARLSGPLGHDRVQLPGIDILRSFHQVLFCPPAYLQRPRSYTVPVSLSALHTLPYEAGEFSVNLVTAGSQNCATVKTENNAFYEQADLDVCALHSILGREQLEIRNWEPGDEMAVRPGETKVKLKQLFQQQRISLWERRHWPVLVAGRQVLWARSFGACANLQPGSGAAHDIYRIRFRPVRRIKDAIESKSDLLTSVTVGVSMGYGLKADSKLQGGPETVAGNPQRSGNPLSSSKG